MSDKKTAALLLPGMSLNATIFPDLGMPVVTPDLGGIDLGENGVTSELVRDGFEVFVRQLVEEIRVRQCWNGARRIVVAHSFGGMLALHWLLGASDRPPPRVDGLVLIASTAGPMYQQVRIRVPGPFGRRRRVGVGWLVPLLSLGQTNWIFAPKGSSPTRNWGLRDGEIPTGGRCDRSVTSWAALMFVNG